MNRSLVGTICAVSLLALGSWMAYVRTQFPPPGQLTLSKLKNDLYEIEGDGGNVAVYVTSAGVVLVDDKYQRDFDGITAKIKTITPLPVKYVFNTHHHADHSGGNGRFLQTAQVISTVGARANIVKDPFNASPGLLSRAFELSKFLLLPPRPWRNRPRLTPARLVFSRTFSIFPGGKEVRAQYFGRGHTNGDAIIYFPEQRTIATGDLVTNHSAFIDYNNGGSLVEWGRTLDEALKLDFDTVIPGHGPVTDRAGLLAYRGRIAKLHDRAASLIRAGKTSDEVAKVMTAEFGWAPGGMEMALSLPGMMKELKCESAPLK